MKVFRTDSGKFYEVLDDVMEALPGSFAFHLQIQPLDADQAAVAREYFEEEGLPEFVGQVVEVDTRGVRAPVLNDLKADAFRVRFVRQSSLTLDEKEKLRKDALAQLAFHVESTDFADIAYATWKGQDEFLIEI